MSDEPKEYYPTKGELVAAVAAGLEANGIAAQKALEIAARTVAELLSLSPKERAARLAALAVAPWGAVKPG
jgi:hypothetical protein